MELGTQIKKHRSELHLSQEELAEKVFVSRQTISNWENDKNYPDINSLLLLSEVFGVSLDYLVKGDIETMKEQINSEELKNFEKDATIFTVLLIATILVPVPLAHFFGFIGIGLFTILAAIALYFALKVEKHKKKYDIQSYKEIIAFTEGKSLSDIEKAREEGKRPYQKILLAIGAGIITLIVAVIMGMLL